MLVSIGYSTCHWCHVMARESFADPETAALINRGFVAIKVDREEHPEVDAAYMAAAAAFTAHLGWPLTVFATPEGRPFYAGTYFPPQPRSGLPSFTQVLGAVTEAWTERREQVDGTAGAVAGALAETRAAASAEGDLPSVRRHRRRRRRDRSSRRPGVRRLRRRRSGRAEVPDRDSAAVSAGRRGPHGEPRRLCGRRSSACRHGRLRAARRGRGRLLPLRDTPRLDRAALRADADRQRAAARGRDRCRRRADRTRHRPLPHRRAAAAVRRVRCGAGLGVLDRRRAQRGRVLREGCRGPGGRWTLRPSTARS